MKEFKELLELTECFKAILWLEDVFKYNENLRFKLEVLHAEIQAHVARRIDRLPLEIARRLDKLKNK